MNLQQLPPQAKAFIDWNNYQEPPPQTVAKLTQQGTSLPKIRQKTGLSVHMLQKELNALFKDGTLTKRQSDKNTLGYTKEIKLMAVEKLNTGVAPREVRALIKAEIGRKPSLATLSNWKTEHNEQQTKH